MDTARKSKGVIASVLAMAAGMSAGLGFGGPLRSLERRTSKQNTRSVNVRDSAAERALAIEHQKWNEKVEAKRNAKAVAKRAAKAVWEGTES